MIRLVSLSFTFCRDEEESIEYKAEFLWIRKWRVPSTSRKVLGSIDESVAKIQLDVNWKIDPNISCTFTLFFVCHFIILRGFHVS